MIEEFEKKEITITVQPHMAATTIGLMRGFLPALIDHLNTIGKETGITVSEKFQGDMKEVLDEIYEKCIPHTNIRENAAKWMEVLEMTGGVWPADKKS